MTPPDRPTPLRVFAHGGGVQSTAALVLSAQGRIDFPVHLFSNVGDDSEHPATLRYVREVSMPYAGANGIELVEIRRLTRDGRAETLLENTLSTERTIGIPVRMGQNGAPGTRRCTGTFKLAPIKKWLREHGATKESPATVGIGFSMDEIERAGRVPNDPYQSRAYPLLDLGLRRTDCFDIIAEAGLPKPPKSACWFCPMHTLGTWAQMRRDEPELFDKAADLEATLIGRRRQLGKDPVYLSRRGRPLAEAISAAEPSLFAEGFGEYGCDEGVCFV